MDHVEALIYEH